jgi:hypothetical protein
MTNAERLSSDPLPSVVAALAVQWARSQKVDKPCIEARARPKLAELMNPLIDYLRSQPVEEQGGPLDTTGGTGAIGGQPPSTGSLLLRPRMGTLYRCLVL